MASALPPKFIEVEIGSFCNRACAWCPNGWHDRGQAQKFMEPRVWATLLADLGRHRYASRFAFHNYNEPLADPSLLEKVADARRAMPKAFLEVYTNGDFLTRERLEELRGLGLDHVLVTRYPPPSHAFKEPDLAELNKFLDRLGVVARRRRENRVRKILQTVRLGRLRLTVRAPRIQHYTRRAGSVHLEGLPTVTRRRRPCYLPYQAAAIDFHGNLKLCCHVYDTQLPENAPYVIGNVGEQPFSKLWSSPKMQGLREQLARARFAGLPACATCTHKMTPRMLQQVKTTYSLPT